MLRPWAALLGGDLRFPCDRSVFGSMDKTL
jgi:hypothetical protein